MNKKLTAESLTKHYPKTLALNDVSFSLTEGFYSLLGSNGTSKTTMVKYHRRDLKAYLR